MLSNRSRRGFTIVELMMVVGIIGILMGIVTTAAASSIKQARTRRADALCAAVEAGLATYYAQNDKWPEPLGSRIASGSLGTSRNDEGLDNQSDDDKYVLTASEVRQMIKAIVLSSKEGNPMMDISGLFVSRDPGEKDGKGYGMDFLDAIHGTKRSPKKMGVSEMYFGYPETGHGYFRRFKIVYSIPTDKMKVSRQ